jgi:phosphohistidine phosphatase
MTSSPGPASRRILRRIAVIRHAKSDWSTPEAPGAAPRTDHARPLNDRGRREAPELARQLRARGWSPRVVLCSDAERTRETWACMAPELPEAGNVIYFNSLYHAGREAAVDALAILKDDDETDGGRGVVYLVGHNPGWEDMVSDVSGVSTTMKTAVAALLEAEAESYAAALSGGMKLVELVQF